MVNLDNNLGILFSRMENFVTSQSVVGEQINIGEMIIIPFMDICLGVGASASDNESKKENGVGGLGAKITPSAVLVVKKDLNSVELINLKNQDGVNKIIDMVPGILSKLNFKKKDKDNNKNQEEN